MKQLYALMQKIRLFHRINELIVLLIQVFFSNTVNPMYRFAIIYSGNNLEEIKNKSSSVHFEKILLTERTRNSISLNENTVNSKYIVITFLDRYGRETTAKVFEMK